MLLPSLGRQKIIQQGKNFLATLLSWYRGFHQQHRAPTLNFTFDLVIYQDDISRMLPDGYYSDCLQGEDGQLCPVAHPQFWVGQQAFFFLSRGFIQKVWGQRIGSRWTVATHMLCGHISSPMALRRAFLCNCSHTHLFSLARPTEQKF